MIGMIPFRPPVSVGSPGGSTILDRIVQAIRKSFDSLTEAFLARPEPGLNGQVLILGPDGLPMWAGYSATTGEERAIQELVPSVQEADSLATATTHITEIDLAASRHYWVTATGTAFAPDESVLFSETLFIRVAVNHAGLATHLTPDTISHSYGSGFTFVSATSGGTLTLNFGNASGSTYTIQVIASLSSARTRV